MTLYALDDVGDAVDATKRFLLPFDRVRWLRLAVVMFFVGGSAASFNFPSVPGDFGSDQPEPTPGDPGQPAPGDVSPELTGELVLLILGVIGLVLAIGLGYMIVSAIMEFVFVSSLRDERVRLKTPFVEHWRKGVRLFGFRLVVGLVSAAIFAAVLLAIGAAVGGWPPTEWGGGAILALLLTALPLVFVAAIVLGNFLGFTTVFVVPVMLLEDRGVVSAWRRFWPTVRSQWKQYLGYAVVGFLLGIGVSIVVGIVGLIAAIVVGIPFLVVGAPLVFVLGLGGIGGLVVLAFVTLYAVVMLVVGLLLQVPFQTFMRYYALFVLGDTNDDFDIIPDARRAVRADGGGDGAGDDDGDADGGSGDTGGDSSGGDDPDGDDSDGWNVDRSDEGWGREYDEE
jgi:MFS family permease